MSQFACPHCKQPSKVAALLGGLEAFSPVTAHFSARCPQCRDYLEFTASSGKLVLGYTYWAGSMHFEGMIDVAAAGLSVDATLKPPALRFAGATYVVAAGPDAAR